MIHGESDSHVSSEPLSGIPGVAFAGQGSPNATPCIHMDNKYLSKIIFDPIKFLPPSTTHPDSMDRPPTQYTVYTTVVQLHTPLSSKCKYLFNKWNRKVPVEESRKRSN